MSVCPDPRWSRWWPGFVAWNDAGRHPALRPKTLPKRVPVRAFECYIQLRNKPKPAVVIPFSTPVAFYKGYDTATVGITEALAIWRGDVAIDPLYGDDRKWEEFVDACHARGRRVYGWTRCWHIGFFDSMVDYQDRFRLAGFFPNIEDDDLRANKSTPQWLEQIAEVEPGQAPNVGVLTNYNVSDEWPTPNPLHHLPVLPEWFPREITDPTATLEGSLDSGRRHFAAALPLLDGRERGLEAFNYPAGAFSIWPADSVENWKGWVR